MRKIELFLVGAALSFSPFAYAEADSRLQWSYLDIQAADDQHGLVASFTPVESINPGRYESVRGYFPYMKLSEWADEYLVEGMVSYGHAQTFLARVAQLRGNLFQGDGELKARYTDGTVCEYPMTVIIKAYEEGLFVESIMPRGIPPQISPGRCSPAGELASFVHPKPYVLRQ